MITKLINDAAQLKNTLRAIYNECRNTKVCPFEWGYELFDELFYNCYVDYFSDELSLQKYLSLKKEIQDAGEQFEDFGGDEKIEEFENRTFDLIEQLDIPYPVSLSIGYVSGRDGDSEAQFLLRDANDMKLDTPEKLVEDIKEFCR